MKPRTYKPHYVTLDDATATLMKNLSGEGNLSAGIRIAARYIQRRLFESDNPERSTPKNEDALDRT